MQNPAASRNYIKAHARETEDDVISRHIQLYVNSFSLSLGDEGKNAVKKMIDQATEKGIIGTVTEPFFI